MASGRSATVAIERCADPAHAGWLALRCALWPHCARDGHLAEMAAQCADPARFVALVARTGGGAVGLAEASVRHDYVNGTDTAPVAFLEGLYVAEDARRAGVARALVAAVEQWARAAGCAELASDAPVANAVSHAVHGALGFAETERVVYFRRALR